MSSIQPAAPPNERRGLRIDRAPEPAFGRSASICSDLAKALDLRPGQVAVLSSVAGHTATIRVVVDDRCVDEGRIEVPSTVRTSLGVRPGQTVQLAPANDHALIPLRRAEITVLRGAVDSSAPRDAFRDAFRALIAGEPQAMSIGDAVRVPIAGAGLGFVGYLTDGNIAGGLIEADCDITIKEGGTIPRPTGTGASIGGLEAESAALRELLRASLLRPGLCDALGVRPARGVLLAGPPGAGKTLLARTVADELGLARENISGSDIIGSMRGEAEANLRDRFAHAVSHAPAVLVIDEIDAIAPRREIAGSLADARLVTQLLTCMDGLQANDGVVVIGTTNRISTLDRALRRPGRFDEEIMVGPPNAAGRLEILEVHTNSMSLDTTAIDCLPAIAAGAHGFVGADIVKLCREAGMSAMRRATAAASSNEGVDAVRREDFEHARRGMTASALRDLPVSRPQVRWADAVGLQDAKSQLSHYAALLDSATNGDQPTAIILSGPAGCGKTMLAQALATERKAQLIHVRSSSLLRRWFAESEEALDLLFETAVRAENAVLLIEEFDGIGLQRGRHAAAETAMRLLHELLRQLDRARNAALLVIGETNRPDLLDDALLHGHRILGHVPVPPPTHGDRVTLLARALTDVPAVADASELVALATRLDGASAAEINTTGRRIAALAQQGRISVTEAALAITGS